MKGFSVLGFGAWDRGLRSALGLGVRSAALGAGIGGLGFNLGFRGIWPSVKDTRSLNS